jgi:Domain of unknown function (DUF397)
MNEGELTSQVWRKSSYSGASGGCVEIAKVSLKLIAVRDSKNTSGPQLLFSSTEWKRFTVRTRG